MLAILERIKKIVADRLAKARVLIDNYKAENPSDGRVPTFEPGVTNPADYIDPNPTKEEKK